MDKAQRKCASCHAALAVAGSHSHAQKGSRCGRCKVVWYCDRQCQVKHWKVHRQTCGDQPAQPIKLPVRPSDAVGCGAGVGAGAGSEVPTEAMTAPQSAGRMHIQEFFEDACVPVSLVADVPSKLGRHVTAKANLPPGVMVLAADRYASTFASQVANAAERQAHGCWQLCRRLNLRKRVTRATYASHMVSNRCNVARIASLLFTVMRNVLRAPARHMCSRAMLCTGSPRPRWRLMATPISCNL